MKSLILLVVILSPILLFSGNSQAISHQTEVGIYGVISEGNLLGKTTGFGNGFCNTNVTIVTFFCINELSNHDSDSTYVTTDFTYLLANFNNTFYAVDGFNEYTNSSNTILDLVSFSFIARVTSGGNDTISVILTAIELGPNSAGEPFPNCQFGTTQVYSFFYGPPPDFNKTSLLTTEYKTFSSPFTKSCDLFNPNNGFNQVNLRDLLFIISIDCGFSICIDYTYEARVTSIYMTVIWHDNIIPTSLILSNADIIILIFLIIIWVVFFILGVYIPSGIFCILGSFPGLVLMLLYILPFANDVVTLVVTGMVICCFIIGAGLAIQGDA